MSMDESLKVVFDEAGWLAQKQARALEKKRQAEQDLETLGLDLLSRWDELRVENVGADGIATALGTSDTGNVNSGITTSSERAAHLKAATRAIPDAILTFTADGRIRTCNAGAERMFGTVAQYLLKQNIGELLPAVPAWIESLAATAPEQASAPQSSESTGIALDGSEIDVEISIGVTTIEDIRYHAAVVRDISERLRSRRELERLNDSLTQQVHETEAALTRLHAAQQQLVQAEKMASLGLLVAGVAHEINTPLGIAITAASVLGDQASGVSEALASGALKKSQLDAAVAAFSQSAGMIAVNLQRAASLVQSFKQVAVDQGSEEWRTIDLAGYLREVFLSLEPRIKVTPHRLELDCPAELGIHTAPGAIAQIVTNLVMNSLIHAWNPGQNGYMRLVVQRMHDGVRFEYRDDGRGLGAEALAQIFDPFYTTRRGDGGSGLGLHIVFNLVHQTLGGQIRAVSEIGAGLSFVLSIPSSPALAASAGGITGVVTDNEG